MIHCGTLLPSMIEASPHARWAGFQSRRDQARCRDGPNGTSSRPAKRHSMASKPVSLAAADGRPGAPLAYFPNFCTSRTYMRKWYHLEHICEDTQSRIFELCSSRGGLRFRRAAISSKWERRVGDRGADPLPFDNNFTQERPTHLYKRHQHS